METPYLNSLSVSVWKEPYSIVTIRQSVRRHPLVGVITCLGCNPLHPGGRSQVNLKKLVPVIVLSNPASTRGTSILRLQPGTPGTVVVVVHGGCRKHRWRNTAILKTEGNITRVYSKIAKSEIFTPFLFY